MVADLVDVTRMLTADPEHRVPHLAFQPDRAGRRADPADGGRSTSYYLRMRVPTSPGVLADITRILADRSHLHRRDGAERAAEGEDQADIIMLTHDAVERNVNAAIRRIEALPTVLAQVIRIRLEELL